MTTPTSLRQMDVHGRPHENSGNVARAFNAVAPHFDSLLENEITATLRAKIYLIAESLLKEGSSILDINCGTGIDALHFAELGYGVTGIDLSPEMISQARRKTTTTRPGKLEFFEGSFEQLTPEIVAPVDLTFSNFGGLNCTGNLPLVADGVAAVTRPGGYFLGVIMPRFSLWESFAFLLRGEWRQTLRRIKKGTLATGFGADTFPVHYYSPSNVKTAFKKYFSVKAVIGLNIFSPTPQSTGFVRDYPRLTRFLRRIDGRIEAVPFFRSIGDHYIIIMQRDR